MYLNCLCFVIENIFLKWKRGECALKIFSGAYDKGLENPKTKSFHFAYLKLIQSFISSAVFSYHRQTSGSNMNHGFGLSSFRRNAADADIQVSIKELLFFVAAVGGFHPCCTMQMCSGWAKLMHVLSLRSQPSGVSPEHIPWEDQMPVDSTTTLLHTRDTSRMEGTVWPNLTLWAVRQPFDNIVFNPCRCIWQLRTYCQYKVPWVMLDISDKSGEKRQPSHRHQPPQ